MKVTAFLRMGFLSGSVVKNPPVMQERCRRRGFDPWVRKTPWRREWLPTPVFFLENPMDGGDWRVTVHGVTMSLMTE